MTAKEFVSRLAPLDFERLALIFNYLADNMHEMRLVTGERLRDELDFAAFHRELAAACRFPESTEVPVRVGIRTGPKVMPSRFNLDFCPDCGHVHVEDDECGFPIGGNRVCRCERAVPA